MTDPSTELANYPGTITMALGALGTAAFAVVDASKAVLPKGGISNVGFGSIHGAYDALFGAGAVTGVLSSDLATLHGNWINGRSMADQQAIAKSLVKLRLDGRTAPSLAHATGVDPGILTSVGQKMSAGNPLGDGEVNVLGRFDLALASLLDDAYQHADQQYRNWSRLAAMVVAVVLGVLGSFAVNGNPWLGVLAGVVATPIAPISKDLTSALAAGVKVAQAMKR